MHSNHEVKMRARCAATLKINERSDAPFEVTDSTLA